MENSLYNENEPVGLNLDKEIPWSSSEIGEELMNKNIPLFEFIKLWLELFKRNEVKPATFDRLVTSNDMLSKCDFGNMLICDISPFDIQRYMNDLIESGYSYSTIKKQFELVKASLRKAASLHVIDENPAGELAVPNKKIAKRKPREIKAYDKREQDRIGKVIAANSDNNRYLCIAFMIETGLRAGEALALKWSDVNTETHRCNVHATIGNPRDPRKSYVQDTPKTDSSIRTVPLTPRATAILNTLRSRASSEFVFELSGRRMEYPELIWGIKRLCRMAGVQYLGAHVFRHTFATNCYYKGIDVKILSKLLGHSDVKVTLNTYINLYGDGFDDMYAALCL